MKDDKQIIKYNSTIQVSNGVSFLAHKCFNVLYNNFFQWIRDAKRLKQETIFDTITNYPYFTIDELKENPELNNINIGFMKVNYLMNKLQMKNNNYSFLTEALKELVNTKIEFNILEQDGKKSWGYYSILSAVDVKDGQIRYEIPTLLLEKLLLIPNYTRINLSIQNRMTNRYALTLYENCLNWYDNSKAVSYSPKMPVERCKHLILGDVTKYPKFIEFSRLLRRIMKEINEVSDLKIQMKKYTELRAVKYIQFIIQKQNIPQSVKRNKTQQSQEQPIKGLNQLKEQMINKRLYKSF